MAAEPERTYHEMFLADLKTKMTSQGMTQYQLAQYSGFTQSHISRIYNKRITGTLEAWERLHQVLDNGKRFCRHGNEIPGRCADCGHPQIRYLSDGSSVDPYGRPRNR